MSVIKCCFCITPPRRHMLGILIWDVLIAVLFVLDMIAGQFYGKHIIEYGIDGFGAAIRIISFVILHVKDY